MNYKISWEILSSRKTKIGFYTSDEFKLGVLNKLYLICGSKGPSLFSESVGYFIFTGNMNLYVAVNRDVEVILKVDTIIPKLYFFPTLTPHNEYIKYIVNGDRCHKAQKVPLYITFLTRETSFSGRTVPGREFEKLYMEMIKYLEETSLNLTLFEFPSALLTIESNFGLAKIPKFQTLTYKNVPSFRQINNYYVTNTDNIRSVENPLNPQNPKGSTLFLTGQYRFISFVLNPGLRPNKLHAVISYKLNIRNYANAEGVYEITLWHWTYGRWSYLDNVDRKTGNSLGKCYVKGTVPGLDSVAKSGYFILDQDATEFNMPVYVLNNLTVIYEEIKIEYVRLPYIPLLPQ